VADIAAELKATFLARPPEMPGIDRVMVGTVASDAAAPYFGNRRRTCVITRFDKTDIQLAALNTDVGCMVLTGGGEPSPYLLDRIAGHRPDVAVLLTSGTTVDAVRDIEPIFGRSRFAGESTKLMRAIELLDATGAPSSFDGSDSG
jgi:BioD-like phosphotransacetylase family protein